MLDNSSPRNGWSYAEYMKYAPVTQKDEHGAIFFCIRELLTKFCIRLQNQRLTFTMFSTFAQHLGSYLSDKKFDRIEVRTPSHTSLPATQSNPRLLSQIANICDRGYLGPDMCLSLFTPLLKPPSANSHATLLLLFINAAAEQHHLSEGNPAWVSDLKRAMSRLTKYIPLDRSMLTRIQMTGKASQDPEFIRWNCCQDMLRDWEMWFGTFLKESKLDARANEVGARIKGKHTIVGAWPSKVGARTTKGEFEILCAGQLTGFERYVEIQRCDGGAGT